jgi:hypothetical protein
MWGVLFWVTIQLFPKTRVNFEARLWRTRETWLRNSLTIKYNPRQYVLLIPRIRKPGFVQMRRSLASKSAWRLAILEKSE